MDGGTLASAVAAGGAVLAAVFSGVALISSHSLERRKWIRDVLVDTFVSVLSLDMDGAHAAIKFAKHRGGLPLDFSLGEATESEIRRIHSECVEIMQRLRLLAKSETYQAAHEMHLVFDDYIELAMGDLPEDLALRLDELSRRSIMARQELVECAREELRLSGAPANIWFHSGAYVRA
jgi:hypothetical protein